VVLALVLIVCLAGSTITLRKLDRLRAGATLEEVLYIPSPAILKRMSLGYTGLMADIYWTRAVQYFGRKHHESAAAYNLLPALLDITTTLDPHLIVAYQFGSVFLAQPPPEGAGMPHKAVQLVERGIRENPEEWRLYYHLGFLHYMELHDPLAAADAFNRGGTVAGAHPWLKVLAASMAQHGGDLQTARFLWTKIYETTDDKMVRANAVKHLQALEVDDTVPKLEAMVRAYRDQYGSLPASFMPLISLGWLRTLPVDPAGHPYKLGPDGRVEVQVPRELPFIHKGLPPGREASLLASPQSK
jgi:hypothetical protein